MIKGMCAVDLLRPVLGDFNNPLRYQTGCRVSLR